MHHADPFGVHQPRGVSMMHECNGIKLLASAWFMDHDEQGHTALKCYMYVELKYTQNKVFLTTSHEQFIKSITCFSLHVKSLMKYKHLKMEVIH